MGSSKFRRAIGHVKDQTSIGLARVGSSTSLSDLDVAIVKATSHNEYPAEEKRIREILSLTSYSHNYISACVETLSRRLNKTRNWVVALKTLMLIQRLLSEGDPAYEQEIFFSTRRGTRILNMSDFRDASMSNSWDYSAFVRAYALYLDERLEYNMQKRRGKNSGFECKEDEGSVYNMEARRRERSSGQEYEEDDEELDDEINDKSIVVRSTPLPEMKTEHIFSRLQRLQNLLDRFLACRPTGSAKCNRIVIVALYPIVKESFQIYNDITEILGILIHRFMKLDISASVKIHEIFTREAKQLEELENFYSWCKSVGVARSSEYPEIDEITLKKLDLMDEFIRDKSALAQGKRIENESMDETQVSVEEEEEEDMNAVKALPAPENFFESKVEEEPRKEYKEDDSKALVVHQEADFLNLEEYAMSSQDHSNQLAMALFNCESANVPTTAPPAWEAFKDEADWESALVQSTSSLANQNTTLGHGFNALILDSMYQQAQTMAAMASSGYAPTGSASSVALGSAGRPSTLALPAPPQSSNCNYGGGDPFAASLAVAPPSYVQMADMEKKQTLLAEENAMWMQYKKDGMQRHVEMFKLQTYPYSQSYQSF